MGPRRGGYQVGNFPVGWAEWNGKYRDSVRRFWRGDGGQVSEFATRLAGSSDLYERSGRRPYASINFITAHDGFTLQDLVSYNEKHNEANGEENRDGANDNESWNCGVEGPTDDPDIVALRERQKRNLFATLMISQGVPMIRGGDELSQTQAGNNNAYCQDTGITWLDWELTPQQLEFLEFARQVVHLRHDQPVLHRRRFFQGGPIRGAGIKDITWFAPDGREMTDEAWTAGSARALGVRLAGDAIDERDERGERTTGDTLLLLLNAGDGELTFKLPPVPARSHWEALVDSANDQGPAAPYGGGDDYPLHARSTAVLLLREQHRRQADRAHRLADLATLGAPARIRVTASSPSKVTDDTPAPAAR